MHGEEPQLGMGKERRLRVVREPLLCIGEGTTTTRG